MEAFSSKGATVPGVQGGTRRVTVLRDLVANQNALMHGLLLLSVPSACPVGSLYCYKAIPDCLVAAALAPYLVAYPLVKQAKTIVDPGVS